MDIDEDTDWWLGSPTPLEMCQQHCLLQENEIQELNLQLRKAREDIFGLINMLSETQAKKEEFAGYLRLRGAEAADMRRQIADLTVSDNVHRREVEQLRKKLRPVAAP
ncbi:hypothetical protein [Pseudomonas sp. B22129]|uniref:hypothetical protein n=1 Tax=Pseudomonas sp. B22129 TaxID=3235111 RepID=UPI0037836273